MTTSPATPAWAVELVHAVCAEARIEPPARLSWRRRASPQSTGVARRAEGAIAVRAGTDERDQRLTLLHELAHWITPWPQRRRTIHHGAAFYRTAFALYGRHGLSPDEALKLESARYPSSLRHAAALGVPGADAALAAHRDTIRERPRRRWRIVVPEHEVQMARDGRWTVCAVCGQRIVGRNLVRARRARRAMRHVLMRAA
jgi:hypothetical protein